MQNSKYEIIKTTNELKKVFEQENVQKPFLCCGKSFQKTELFKFLNEKYNLTIFDNIRPNPRFEDMVDAAKIFNENNCDFMIGAGGGSPMDSAKMIRLMTSNDISKCLNEPMKNNEIKQLLIPTTSGSGAEATKSSVFYINENEKLSISNYDFLPDYIYFDANMLNTVPSYQRSCTCMDALCHAIESYINTNSNEESKSYARKAITLFNQSLDSYLNNEYKGNQGMLEASFYAGKSINITGTAVPHAMCYNITMNCGTSHGHSVAAGLVEIWKYMIENFDILQVNDKRGIVYVANTFSEIAELLGVKTAEEVPAVLQDLLNKLNLNKPSVDYSLLDSFVSKVNIARLGNNPMAFDKNDIKTLYTLILNEN